MQRVIEKLRVVMRSVVFEEGDWTIGNAILGVCRNILQNHDTKSVAAGLLNPLNPGEAGPRKVRSLDTKFGF